MQLNRMKTYYEFLGATPDATMGELEQAYRQACDLYAEESVAAYSLYSSEEKNEMLTKVTEAYDTLKDTDKRRNYDATLNLSSGENKEVRSTGTHHEKTDRGALFPESEGAQKSFKLKKPLFSMEDGYPIVAEQYRILSTKLEQISHKQSIKTFAVTSSVLGEGKSTTSLNLSYILAKEFRKKVILVECDLRAPSITPQCLDIEMESNLVNVIRGKIGLKRAISRFEDSNLYLLPAGGRISNPASILSDKRLQAIFNDLKTGFDYVIVDAPPILPLADINLLVKIVDGLLLVVKAGKTPKDIVSKAIDTISREQIVGVVLNSAETSIHKYYY
jgi:capsular exopolysaccharide synthesis family protein